MKDWSSFLEKKAIELQSILEQQKQLTKKIDERTKLYQDCEEAQNIVQQVAKMTQETAHQKIASLVTKCLRDIFGDPYEFKIVFEQKRGKTEAKCVVVRDGMTLNPMEEAGGGVVDVLAFALRLTSLLLRRKAIRKFLVLDEPFKFVSKEYRERVASLLLELSHELDVQLVLVSHLPEFQLGKTLRLQKTDL